MPNPSDPPICPLTPAGFLRSAVWRRAGAACVVAACVVVPAVHAEKADRTQPMNAEADALRHDDANQISLFTGNVVVTTEGRHKVTITGVNAGTLIPLSITRVWSTNTTATSMLGFIVNPSEYGDDANIDATDSISTEYTDRAGTGFLVDRRGFNIIARA